MLEIAWMVSIERIAPVLQPATRPEGQADGERSASALHRECGFSNVPTSGCKAIQASFYTFFNGSMGLQGSTNASVAATSPATASATAHRAARLPILDDDNKGRLQAPRGRDVAETH